MLIPLAFVPPKKLRELIGGSMVMAFAIDVARDVSLTWQTDISVGFLRGQPYDRFLPNADNSSTAP
jgi:hypothetical protein